MKLSGFLIDAINVNVNIKYDVLEQWFATKTIENKLSTFKENNRLKNDFLETSLKQEFSFKSLTEFYASKAILDIVKISPTLVEYDFLNTLLIDETHHSYLFRTYLKENGL